MPNAKQWEEALRTEMKQLERLGVVRHIMKTVDGLRVMKLWQQ